MSIWNFVLLLTNVFDGLFRMYVHVYALFVQVHMVMCAHRYTRRPEDNRGHHPTAGLHLVLSETNSLPGL